MLSNILFLLISILLLIQCSWNLSTFLRLTTAASLYNKSVTESALQMSNEYINTGRIVSIICVLISIGLLIFSSVKLGINLKKK